MANHRAAPAASEPDFDSVKIERITSAIASGKLKVNPEAIASGLISSVTELLRSSE